MNRKYLFRNNFKGVCNLDEESFLGHLAFKTQDVSWLDTSSSVIVLVSVNSAFHERGEGWLKMEALLATIKRNVRGAVAILIADTAHLCAERLLLGSIAEKHCMNASEELVSRYRSLFAGYQLFHWHSINQDDVRSEVMALFHSDETFRGCLLEDAESAYTEKRRSEFPDKTAFIKATLMDLIEQCVVLQVLARRQFGYIFYPGAPCKATEYLRTLLSDELKWIDVFLTIEKKTRILQFV